MAVPVSTEDGFHSGAPVPLFQVGARLTSAGSYNYDVSRDGQRFLLAERVDDPEAREASVTLIRNWSAHR